MTIKGRCHCGATQFTVAKRPDSVVRCTCSFCSKRGALWAYYPEADFALITSRDRIATYQWNTYTSEHHHCQVCGCTTFSRTAALDEEWNPKLGEHQYSVNALLLEGFDFDAQPIEIVEGASLW